MPDSEFTALLCSRLCHDLISPVGAITNGLEVLAEEDDEEMRSQILAMLEQSAKATSSRLKFYRLAFGSAGGFGEAVDVREAHAALAQYLEGNKIALDWESDEEALEKRVLKLLLNFALLASEALIRGGSISVSIKRVGDDCRLQVIAQGERFLLSNTVRSTAIGENAGADLEPRTAPAHLAYRLARDLNAPIDISQNEKGAHIFSATIPLPL